MANGKFHGKKRTGVRITNPLSLPAQLRIKSPTGALHTGDGKETWRTIKPGETLYIPTKGRAELDIDVHIIRYNPAGNSQKIGDGSFEHVATRKPAKRKPVLGTASRPISVNNTGDVVSDGKWHVITTWAVPGNTLGHLKKVVFHIQPMEPGAKGSVKLEVVGLGNTNVRNLGGKTFYRSTTVDYDKTTLVQPNDTVRIVAKSQDGITRVLGVIEGLEIPASVPREEEETPRMPRPARKVKRKEPEEPPLRSLGEMIEEMRREEEVVKV